MKIFITGTESFVAQALIKKLDFKGYNLTGCDTVVPSDKRFFQADIRSKTLSDKISTDIDIIVHLAALSSDPLCKGNDYSCFDINVMGTLNIMNLAKEKKCKQFIFASTEWVYENINRDDFLSEEENIDVSRINSEYALSKFVSEINLKHRHQLDFCDVTILRFGIIYGPRNSGTAVESIFKSIYMDHELSIGSKYSGRCFLHIDDLSGAIVKSLGLKGFNILNIVGDELITMNDIIIISEKILGKVANFKVSNNKVVDQRKISNVLAKKMIKWRPKIDIKRGLSTIKGFHANN